MKLPIDEHKKKHPHDIRKATVIAFVVSRGSIVSVGYNRRVFLRGMKFSTHAEESVLSKAGRRSKGATLCVVRVKKDNSWGTAQPCMKCWMLINKSGIVKVRYSLNEVNKWQEINWSNSQWTRLK